MPMFDFKCERCKKSREVLSGKLPDIQVCTCGGLMVRQVSRSSFQLRGSSWYKDGYK